MECAARVAQETVGHGLPARDRVRRPVRGGECVRLRDALAGAVRPAIWPLLLTAWFAARRRAVRPGRPPVAHPETLCPGRGRRNTGVGGREYGGYVTRPADGAPLLRVPVREHHEAGRDRTGRSGRHQIHRFQRSDQRRVGVPGVLRLMCQLTFCDRRLARAGSRGRRRRCRVGAACRTWGAGGPGPESRCGVCGQGVSLGLATGEKRSPCAAEIAW